MTAESGAISHPVDFYEGFWLCSGYTRDGVTVSFSDLSDEDRKTFPYLTLEIRKGEADLRLVPRTEGEYYSLIFGDCCATSDGIRIIHDRDYIDLELMENVLVLRSEEAENLKSIIKRGLYPYNELPQDNATYYFEKVFSNGQLTVLTYEFDGISLDVPTDVAYYLDAETPECDESGCISVGRTVLSKSGASMVLKSHPTDASDIAEEFSEWEGEDARIKYADNLIEYGGTLFFVDQIGAYNDVCVLFVVNGKSYFIEFDYYSEDIVDYSDYAKYLYTQIRINREASTVEKESPIPSGAISWQEAPQHVGETVTVYGPVADVEYADSSNGRPTFIDLGVAYPDPNRVTIVIWGEDRYAFPESPERLYGSGELCVTGEIYVHDGVCNIKVVSPSQVQKL